MADLKITDVYTANEFQSRQDNFRWNDRFMIVVVVERSKAYRDPRIPLELLIQLVCPRLDIGQGTGPWWTTVNVPGGGIIAQPRPTIDFSWTDIRVEKKTLTFTTQPDRYSEIMGSVGGASIPGVFAVRAAIRAIRLAAFAMSAPFAATYHLMDEPAPPASGGGKPTNGPPEGGGDGDPNSTTRDPFPTENTEPPP